MKEYEKLSKNDEFSVYMEDPEYIANQYVMRCYSATMLVYAITFVFNLMGIFVIEQGLMMMSFVTAVIIYISVLIASKFISMSNSKMKYFLLFSIVVIHTLTGVFITYHVVLTSLFPLLYATLYSSKKVMRYMVLVTFFSMIIIVYGGYFFGLCDANMVLLTSEPLKEYVVNGQFALQEINSNPALSLLLFFVIPRCLICMAFAFVCSRIFTIVNGSIERAKLTAELERAKKEAEDANRAKSDFLAKMSHEIRTPINAIMGMNEMIIRESRESEIQEYAYDVKDSSVMLLNIVNEILDSTKIESGMMEIIPVNYEICSLLNDLYNMIYLKAEEKNLQLVFDIDTNIPGVYFGDDKRIRQVLLNILTNAVKYTNQGAVTLALTCDTDGENAVLHFAVKDTGIGIKAEDISRIYDAFQRFDLAKNKDVEGSGLGMNISQQLLKLMGSELYIESEYGKGSEFSFRLTQKIVDRKPVGDFRENFFRASEEKTYRTSFYAPDARVLVVDDCKMNIKVFKKLMKSTGMQIFEADSGNACLDMLRHQTFDIVFLDHMMPGLDGIETLHIIQEQKLCGQTPIIMLTANAIIGDREKYIAEGFHDFLSKPIIPEKLDKMFLHHLPKRLLLDELPEEETKENVTDNIPEEIPVTKASSVVVTANTQIDNTVLAQLSAALPEVDFAKGMETADGDEEFLLELIQDFSQLSIKEELTKFFAQSDYKNYGIRIHGFKNNAYSIGAKTLGDLAFEMEKRTRESIPGEIEKLQERLFEQYDKICKCYSEISAMQKGE